MKYKIGDRVTLPANLEEDWAEENGVVEAVEKNNMFIVRVKQQGPEDDGIREVNGSDMRLNKPRKTKLTEKQMKIVERIVRHMVLAEIANMYSNLEDDGAFDECRDAICEKIGCDDDNTVDAVMMAIFKNVKANLFNLRRAI